MVKMHVRAKLNQNNVKGINPNSRNTKKFELYISRHMPLYTFQSHLLLLTQLVLRTKQTGSCCCIGGCCTEVNLELIFWHKITTGIVYQFSI
jgi:hypothetical protein